jgi:branched-chain amino acid transport system ATP-binding protein
MTGALLDVRDLTKRFGGLIATDRVNLQVMPGELHAIIGPNGAGKTTLLAQLSGELRPDAGTIRFAGEDVTPLPAYSRSARGIARSFQITSVFTDLTVQENVALCVQTRAGHSFRFWAAAHAAAELQQPAERFLQRVGLADRAYLRAGALAHGEKRALEIAMALACRPQLLLLDEPMAGMSLDDSSRMIQLLLGLKGKVTILLIEHDMDAVFALSDRLTVLVYGRVIATGEPTVVRRMSSVHEAYLGETAR